VIHESRKTLHDIMTMASASPRLQPLPGASRLAAGAASAREMRTDAFRAFEVPQSSWLRLLEQRDRVHPTHMPETYRGRRHFILTFKDSTFECSAGGYRPRYATSLWGSHASLAQGFDWSRRWLWRVSHDLSVLRPGNGGGPAALGTVDLAVRVITSLLSRRIAARCQLANDELGGGEVASH
jgi:hypothetical protein